MELNIHENTHDSNSVASQHRIFCRNINRKDVDNQIGVVQHFSLFSSIIKYFRIGLVVTNNILAYAKYINHDRQFIERKKK